MWAFGGVGTWFRTYMTAVAAFGIGLRKLKTSSLLVIKCLVNKQVE